MNELVTSYKEKVFGLIGSRSETVLAFILPGSILDGANEERIEEEIDLQCDLDDIDTPVTEDIIKMVEKRYPPFLISHILGNRYVKGLVAAWNHGEIE